MTGTARDRVLTALDERNVILPEYGLTLEKFDELDGRNVPEEDKEAIVELLLDELKGRAEIN